MNADIHRDILQRLTEFNFKEEQKGWLRGGKCPSCSKKQLYTNADHPWVLRCGRLNNCGWEGHVKELYPDLFEKWSERYPTTPQNKNPNAAADAYLKFGRGFELARVQGSYKQETYFDRELNIGSATVRFPISTGYWERVIDQPHRFGKMKARFQPGMSYNGTWWKPPALVLQSVKELWLVEGIFDAIALDHHDTPAVALLTCHNYPEKALEDLAAARGNKDVKLVWALDGDNAGRSYTRKWVEKAREAGWECYAVQIPQSGRNKLDWNDVHQRDRLRPQDIAEYRHHGALLIAKTPAEKAVLMYMHDNKSVEFDFEFSNRLFWFKLDLDAYNKARQTQEDTGDDNQTEEAQREEAIYASHTIRPIANCLPRALYFQENLITNESWYYFRVEFPHDGKPVKNTFSSAQITSAAEFKKRLLGMAAGAMFSGTTYMLDQMMERQLYDIKRVETIDYIGYSIEHGCYVLGDVATKDGVLHDLNGEDFFEIGKLSLKSLNRSVTLQINREQSEYQYGLGGSAVASLRRQGAGRPHLLVRLAVRRADPCRAKLLPLPRSGRRGRRRQVHADRIPVEAVRPQWL